MPHEMTVSNLGMLAIRQSRATRWSKANLNDLKLEVTKAAACRQCGVGLETPLWPIKAQLEHECPGLRRRAPGGGPKSTVAAERRQLVVISFSSALSVAPAQEATELVVRWRWLIRHRVWPVEEVRRCHTGACYYRLLVLHKIATLSVPAG